MIGFLITVAFITGFGVSTEMNLRYFRKREKKSHEKCEERLEQAWQDGWQACLDSDEWIGKS
jgi:NAD-dependent SIR2 family protein deacetylase